LPVHTSIDAPISLAATTRANAGSAAIAVPAVARAADRESRALRVGLVALRTQ